MKKILVYDDEGEMQNRLCARLRDVEELKGRFEVQALRQDEFGDTMDVLKQREKVFRSRGAWDEEQMAIDDAALLVVDYDLFQNPKDAFLTGETVAYLARCFSRCGLIIGINQPPLRDFDLTLRGRPDSFADLNITERHLDNRGLWGGPFGDFRPWQWPQLPDFYASFEKRVNQAAAHLDEPIWQLLGFDQYTFETLPRSIADFLGGNPAEITLRKFALESGNGMRAKDIQAKDGSDTILARVGAARISKWLERMILPGQDILVDAPHLVSRFPSLIAGDPSSIEDWNKTASLGPTDDLGIHLALIQEHRFASVAWLSRPAWFWDHLRSSERIREVQEPWNAQMPDWVFCEDVSAFHAREQTTMFVAETESPYSRRFALRPEGYEYGPLTRFSS